MEMVKIHLEIELVFPQPSSTFPVFFLFFCTNKGILYDPGYLDILTGFKIMFILNEEYSVYKLPPFTEKLKNRSEHVIEHKLSDGKSKCRHRAL